MPHDAATYAESVKQRTSPADTATNEQTHVTDQGDIYSRAAESSYDQYKGLTLDAPTVSDVSPSSITADSATPITVTGTGFTDDCEIVVDGSGVETVIVSETEATAEAYVFDPGTVAVKVQNTVTGQVSNSVSLTVS